MKCGLLKKNWSKFNYPVSWLLHCQQINSISCSSFPSTAKVHGLVDKLKPSCLLQVAVTYVAITYVAILLLCVNHEGVCIGSHHHSNIGHPNQACIICCFGCQYGNKGVPKNAVCKADFSGCFGQRERSEGTMNNHQNQYPRTWMEISLMFKVKKTHCIGVRFLYSHQANAIPVVALTSCMSRTSRNFQRELSGWLPCHNSHQS